MEKLYEIGDTVKYTGLRGELRVVTITAKCIRNGEKSFEGALHPAKRPTWGYDRWITSVRQQERLKVYTLKT